MNRLSVIDTHCDTAFELYHRSQGLLDGTCHVSLNGACEYENYAQFFAVWADRRKSDDECFDDFIKISDNLFSEIQNNSSHISFVTDFSGMTYTWSCGKRAAYGGTYENFNQCKSLPAFAHEKVPPLCGGGEAPGKEDLPSEYRPARSAHAPGLL